MLRRLRWCYCRRWICRRRRCGPITFFCTLATISFFLSVASFAYALRHEVFDAFVKCSEEHSLDYINAYCQLYKEGKITGSLCQPLCETGLVQFSKCTNFHAGKRVSIMSCSDYCIPGQSVSAVLKYPNLNSSAELDDHPDFLPDEAKSPKFHRHTSDMIQKMVNRDLGFAPFPSDVDMMVEMWERDYAKYTKTSDEERVAYRTIMMLMDQTEYLLVKALESSGIVPHIYGTCGPLYLQESCPPGLLDVPVISVTRAKPPPVSWQETARTLIQLLQLVQRLEQDFPQVLHVCDVKGSNFGVCADGSVKVIDADNVFSHSSLMYIFNTSQCQTHEDCNFFDCGGWCHADTGQCVEVITNNNLQTVCRDVLTSAYPDFLNIGSLFSNAPASIAPKLKTALKECVAQTGTEMDIPVIKPSLSLLNRLVRLLMASLTETDDF